MNMNIPKNMKYNKNFTHSIFYRMKSIFLPTPGFPRPIDHFAFVDNWLIEERTLPTYCSYSKIVNAKEVASEFFEWMGRTINSSIIKERVADDVEKSRLSRQKLSIPNILVFHRAVYEFYLIRRVNSVKHKVNFNMLYHHKIIYITGEFLNYP